MIIEDLKKNYNPYEKEYLAPQLSLLILDRLAQLVDMHNILLLEAI